MNVFRDLVYPVLGYGLLIFGAFKIYRPAGYIVAGVVLLVLSIAPRPKIQ